ncbi:hypothetical protein A616_17185 [Brevibacillus brevis X23]|nr:hypothetical protein A616_17185 [Brevibacillus brevis X23]
MARISLKNKMLIVDQAERTVRKALELKAYNSHGAIDWNEEEIKSIGLNDVTYGVLQQRSQTQKANRCIFEVLKGSDIEEAIEKMIRHFRIDFGIDGD